MRVIILACAAALCSCTTETKERNLTGMWTSTDPAPTRSDRPAEAPQETPREAPVGTVVVIPAEIQGRMAEFVNRPSTLFADSVEIDLSRNGWFSLATFAISPDAVERLDQEDSAAGMLTITLTRRPGVPATPDAIPTVHFGDGMRVAAVDRVVLRVSAAQSAERPFWFHAVGAGKHAIYSVESQPPQEWKGSSVDLRSDVRRVGGSYRFDWSAEAKP